MGKEKQENCIIDCRVSDTDQLKGGSLEDQELVGRRLAEQKGWKVVHVFKKPHSATTSNRDDLDAIKQYIRTSKVPIHHYIVKSIDRFTRTGYVGYVQLKSEIEGLGVQFWDTQGVIQPTRNTLEHIGDFEYWWSVYSPTEIAEMFAAYQGKVEVRDILSRMIGAEITLAGNGYAVRRAPDGLRNKRILVNVDGATKERCVREADPERAHYFAKMFELRVQGIPDMEIVDILNAEGFRTQVYNRWDRTIPDKPKIIGKGGGKLLTVKQLKRFLSTTEYAGVVCEKWTHYQPVRSKEFPGLVSINTFNAANRGRVYIRERTDGSVRILHGYSPFGKVQRLSNNPVYPFKFLPCHICGKQMLGSAPRGKTGRQFPIYHCGGRPSRNHAYYGIKKAEFELNVERYLASLEYTEEFFKAFEREVLQVHRNHAKEVISQSAKISHNVGNLKEQLASKIGALEKSESPVVGRLLEQQIEELHARINQAEGRRKKIELKEKDVNLFLHHVQEVMEHPAEFLMERENMYEQRELFGLVFKEMPSYADILSGTPKLSLAFELSEDFKVSKVPLVSPLSLEWNSLEEMVKRWNDVFQLIESNCSKLS